MGQERGGRPNVDTSYWTSERETLRTAERTAVGSGDNRSHALPWTMTVAGAPVAINVDRYARNLGKCVHQNAEWELGLYGFVAGKCNPGGCHIHRLHNCGRYEVS